MEPKIITKTQCASCGKFFVGERDYDSHLVGGPGDRGPGPRRCLSTGELTDAGWQTEDHVIINFRDFPNPGPMIARAVRPVWVSKQGLKSRSSLIGWAETAS